MNQAPRVGVACLIRAGKKIVLGRRACGVNVGKWVLPGGGIEFGETWQDAAVREVKEETGLTVKALRLERYVMQIIGRETHRLCLVAWVRVVGSIEDMRSSDELSEVRAFRWNEVPLDELHLPVRNCLIWRGLIRLS